MEKVRVKICGITTLADGLAAIELGADLLGFNFYPPSPRSLAPAACARLVSALKDHGARAILVGIFVNEPPERVIRILDECGLDLAQLSGDEPLEALAALGGRVYKGLRPAGPDTALRDAARYAAPSGAPALLIDAPPQPGDAPQPTQYGGTGRTGDWTLAEPLARRYPLLLAGGLNPENVAAAIRRVRPWGVDVASGVESAPGRKDYARLQRFIQAARNPIQEVEPC